MSENDLSPQEIAKRIRDKVVDLNDDLLLAALAEVNVEFEIRPARKDNAATEVTVWCTQEV